MIHAEYLSLFIYILVSDMKRCLMNENGTMLVLLGVTALLPATFVPRKLQFNPS
jgi:hypothetical protein